MRYGVAGVGTDETLRPDELARLVEGAGYDFLVLGEHSHIPAARTTPYPGGDLPRDYTRTLDLFVSLTAAAMATTTLRLSSGIMQLSQRDAISTAKAAATLDLLSGGRLELITGAGWNVEEMRNHGVDPDTKYELVHERILAMREIWANDEASFHGRFVDFDRIWSWPKPVQEGGVPLILGGNSPGSEERAIEYGDGWAPLPFPGVLERVQAFTAREGAPPVTIVGIDPDPAVISDYAEAGADSIILWLPSAAAGEVERSLAEWREVLEAVAH
jgi:probable F420-dependent oxidoreductase